MCMLKKNNFAATIYLQRKSQCDALRLTKTKNVNSVRWYCVFFVVLGERNERQQRHIIPNIRQSSFAKSQKIQNVHRKNHPLSQTQKGMQLRANAEVWQADQIEGKLSDTRRRKRTKNTHTKPHEPFNSSGMRDKD